MADPTYIGNRASSSLTFTAVSATQLTLTTAASTIVPGTTSFAIRNHADSANNLLVSDAGAVTVRAGLTVTASGLTITAGALVVTSGAITATLGDLTLTAGNLIFGTASSRIIPGATSLLFRDAANSNTNITITDAGAVTIRSTLTVTGGVVASGGYTARPYLVHTGGRQAILSTDGTDSTPSVTETYWAEIFVPCNISATGVSIFNGSATGSGNVTVYVMDSAGVQVATSASTAIVGTDVYQRVPLTGGPIALKGPASYFIASQYNNTASRFNTHLFGDFPAGKITSTVYGTFASFTSATTFTASLGPYASLY